MDTTTLEQSLKRLRTDRARAEYLRRLIPLQEKRLEMLKEDERHAKGHALPPDIPRQAGAVGNPTAATAIRLLEDSATAEIRVCARQLRELKREALALETHLGLMDCLLGGLTEEDRFLVTERLIGHGRWPAVAERYEIQFGLYCGLSTLRRRLRLTLQSLCRAA